MEKAPLTSFLYHVALKNSADNTSKLVMQTMTPLKKSFDGVEHPLKNTKCPIAIHDEEGPRLIEVDMTYDVREDDLVDIAWKQAFKKTLRLEPVRRLDENGTVSDGVVAFVASERPILTLTVITDNHFLMQIGDFDKSMLFHPGNLMGLSEQIIDNGRAS